MEKLYNRIDWHNNTSPAINETNLNRMSKAVDDIDNRVVDIAGTVMETVPQIQEDLAEAQELIEDAEELTTHPPVIGQNGHWWVWDTSIDDYADSGVDAGVSFSIGSTTTLPAGSDATVTNTGTATDPVLNFGIPQGEAGQTGAGVSTGGTTGQVLAKASGTDYDTEWVDASGGSGGHTILNGSGTAMNQRADLQFEGIYVTDDSTNDKTKVSIPQFTQAGWDALSSTDKAKYNGCQVIIKDDMGEFCMDSTLSVFAGYGSFTPPTPSGTRCTIESGGYKQVGKTVYVYMKIKPGSSTTFWTNGGGGGIAGGMPKAAFVNQATLNCAYYVPHYGYINAYIYNDQNNEGNIYISCTPSQSMTLTSEITIQGVYLAE